MFESNLVEFQAILTWVVSFSVFIMLVAFFGCVCGCKKKNGDKDEWLGKEGKLKPLNSSEDDPAVRVNGDTQKNSNRASTANRSLPDIPINELRDMDPTWESNQLTNTSDNCSELYATVGENPNPDGENRGKKRQAPSIPHAENGLTEPSTSNSKVSSHQYAKLSHPYARVKPPPPKNDTHASTSTVTQPSIELESSENTLGTHGGSETTLSSSTDQPIPPPRTRRSSSQSNLFLPSSSSPSVSVARSANTLPSYPACSSPTLAPDSIQAGPAIMGKISASQELPYITLPIDNLRHNSVPADLPVHTNGHNGANGVDEPDNAPGQEDVDQRNPGAGHFSGDSQDSSKGYTSISVREPLASIRAQTGQMNRRLDPHYATVSDDSDEMYAAIEDRSESETYAQIVPLPQQQPPPPSVDSLRNTVAENHSRQASSSSATSSVAVVGSPKPEKRQANSPLPPPPSVPPPNVSPPPTPTPLPQSKLDEMYAKVNKKKNSKENTPTHSNVKEASPRAEPSHVSLDLNSGYESLQSGRPSLEPNYESVTSNLTDNDSTSGYAVVASKNSNDPGYELVRNPVRSFQQQPDPNYEELGHKSEPVLEPNYEMLNGEPNYEPLKSPSSSTQDDPNYESVSSLQEPPYEQLEKASNSAGDILYATVNKINKKAA